MGDIHESKSSAPLLLLAPPKSAEKEAVPFSPKHAEYLIFVNWIATPTPYREPKSQGQLAEKIGVDETTLSRWKSKEGFWDDVRAELRRWMKGQTNNVIGGLYNSILRNAKRPEVELWLELAGEIERKPDMPMSPQVIVPVQVNVHNDRQKYG